MLKENTLCTITLRRSQHYYQLSEIRAIHVRFFQPSVEYYNGSISFPWYLLFNIPTSKLHILPSNQLQLHASSRTLADLVTESIYAFRRHPNPFWFDYHVPTYSLAILNCLAGLVAWPSPYIHFSLSVNPNGPKLARNPLAVADARCGIRGG